MSSRPSDNDLSKPQDLKQTQVMDYQAQQCHVIVSLASAYAFPFTAWMFMEKLTLININIYYLYDYYDCLENAHACLDVFFRVRKSCDEENRDKNKCLIKLYI